MQGEESVQFGQVLSLVCFALQIPQGDISNMPQSSLKKINKNLNFFLMIPFYIRITLALEELNRDSL